MFWKPIANQLGPRVAILKHCRSFTSIGPKPYRVPATRWGQNRAARLELAAVYRGLNQLDLNEGVCNHLTVMAPKAEGEGDVMLLVPYSLHWEEVTASNLIGLDREAKVVEGSEVPELSASCIHLGIRRVRPEATVILHTHQPYATSLACMKDPTLKMVHQNSTRFFDRVSYDQNYNGLADALQEGERLGSVLGKNDVLFMGNHGVIVVAPTVSLAFDKLYYLERAAQVQVLTESLNRPICLISDVDASATSRQFKEFEQKYADAFFYSFYRRLRRSDPDFEL